MEDRWSKDGHRSKPIQVNGVEFGPAKAILEYLMFDSSSVMSSRLDEGLLDLIDYLRMERLLNLLKTHPRTQVQVSSFLQNKRV